MPALTPMESHSNYAASAEEVRSVVTRTRQACRRAGRDPGALRFPAHVFTFVAGTTDEMPDEHAAIERWRSLLESVPILLQEAGLPDGPVTADAARVRAACGSPDTVRQRLDEYITAGATNIVVCDLNDAIATIDALIDPP